MDTLAPPIPSTCLKPLYFHYVQFSFKTQLEGSLLSSSVLCSAPQVYTTGKILKKMAANNGCDDNTVRISLLVSQTYYIALDSFPDTS